MTPRVTIDPEVCIGSGNCTHLAPGAFELDDEGVAEVVDPAAASHDQLLLAERSCPTGAITVEQT